ncbi:MAG: TIGR01777 family protein [Planctomycetes bacterium]|nr:TIGR01777 family protein [Planctomycetota bacterium]
MKIAITGASGFVGEALCGHLAAAGHQVLRFVRRRPTPGIEEAHWNAETGKINANALASCDAVVHLAGANVAEKRWSAARKEELCSSRVAASRFLAETLAGLETGPRVLVAASAIGFYGDRGDEVLTEESTLGEGFLAELCRDWEAALEPARVAGIRVVNLRIGLVLGQGGALAKMLLPFKLGLGGRLGSGKQWLSWIDRDDLAALFATAVFDDRYQGVINAVAPENVSNSSFTKTLGRVLRRPTVLPVPAFMMRLLFGEMADALFFSSARVEPRRALDLGFEFRRPELEQSLRHVLGR